MNPYDDHWFTLTLRQRAWIVTKGVAAITITALIGAACFAVVALAGYGLYGWVMR